MKKILAMLLAGLMVFSVMGCSQEEDDVRGEIKGNNKQVEEQTEDKEVSVMDTLGNMEEAVYENEYLGIGFTLPSDWVFYTDEQMQEMNGIVQGALDEDIAKQLEEANLVYDMMAQGTTGNTVNVVIEKISSVSGKKITEEDYVEQSKDALVEALGQMGVSEISAETCSVSLAGEEHAALSIVGSMSGIVLHEKVVCMKVGSYIACVSTVSINEDVTDDIFSNFYSLK